MARYGMSEDIERQAREREAEREAERNAPRARPGSNRVRLTVGSSATWLNPDAVVMIRHRGMTGERDSGADLILHPDVGGHTLSVSGLSPDQLARQLGWVEGLTETGSECLRLESPRGRVAFVRLGDDSFGISSPAMDPAAIIDPDQAMELFRWLGAHLGLG